MSPVIIETIVALVSAQFFYVDTALDSPAQQLKGNTKKNDAVPVWMSFENSTLGEIRSVPARKNWDLIRTQAALSVVCTATSPPTSRELLNVG